VFSIVGVDCATVEARTGLAFGVLSDDGKLEVHRATFGTAGESASATIAAFVSEASQYLIAFDAPLGWPAKLSRELAAHGAGERVACPPDQLFQRETDRFVRRKLRKKPLEVGADRIARTAHAALRLLAEIRSKVSSPVPLAWEPGKSSGVIEVYPAATLLSRGISPSGYKGNEKKEARKARASILDRLSTELASSVPRELLIENHDLLDAVICVLAGADFARKQALLPRDRALAEREGWIWFRGRGQQALF
jgi:predicted RNase H-like nuclease